MSDQTTLDRPFQVQVAEELAVTASEARSERSPAGEFTSPLTVVRLRDPEPVAVQWVAAPEARVREMFSTHYDFVWRSLRRLGVGNDGVDDAAQETFLVAARRISEIAPGAERAFLFGTALRVASQARRAKSRRPELRDDEAIDGAADPSPDLDELTDRKRAREMLDQVLETLPIDLRAAFTLFELEGLTMAEIASCLEVPPGTVASRIRRAREMFQKEIMRRKASGRIDR